MRRTSRRSTLQLTLWRGKFGNDYTKRNVFTPLMLKLGMKAYRRMFAALNISSVLEVGSNTGFNLQIIHRLYPVIKLFAVEPNAKALHILTTRKEIKAVSAWNNDASSLPFADNSVDLVFTSGVLIHIAPENLLPATREVVRVAKKYVLCIEYFSHIPQEIRYREKDHALFKRDFGSYYLDHFKNLKTLRYGFFWQREFPMFDNLNWWLLRKTAPTALGRRRRNPVP